MQSESDSYNNGKVKSWSEWIGLLFAVLGFLTQSIHGMCLHMHIKYVNNFDNRKNLLYNENSIQWLNSDKVTLVKKLVQGCTVQLHNLDIL